MAKSVNTLQQEIARAAASLAQAREELRQARHDALTGLITRREFERRLDAALARTRRDPIAVHAACIWISTTSRSSTTPAAMRRATSCCARSPDCCAPRFATATAWRAWAATNSPCCWRTVRRKPAERIAQDSAADDPGVQFRVGGQDLQDRRQHRPGRVPRRQRRAARADARRRRCLLRREEEGSQSHPRLPAGGQSTWRRGKASWIGSADCAERWMKAASACTRRRWLRVSAARKGERHQELLVRMIDDDQRADRSHGVHSGRRTLQPHARRGSTGHFHRLRGVRAHHRARGPRRHPPVGDQPVGRVFDRGRFSGVRPHAVRACSASLTPSICFEITETAAIANLAKATHLIRELKALGCGFSLDDFGSGMSSFGYLKHLPVDHLKIDGAFVRDIVDDPIDRAMVEAINKVGHVMGITTIAECVETPQTLAILEEIGVDYAQGFAIARPQAYISTRELTLLSGIDELGLQLERSAGVLARASTGVKLKVDDAVGSKAVIATASLCSRQARDFLVTQQDNQAEREKECSRGLRNRGNAECPAVVVPFPAIHSSEEKACCSARDNEPLQVARAGAREAIADEKRLLQLRAQGRKTQADGRKIQSRRRCTKTWLAGSQERADQRVDRCDDIGDSVCRTMLEKLGALLSWRCAIGAGKRYAARRATTGSRTCETICHCARNIE